MLNAGTLVEKYGNKITGQGGARTYPYPLKKVKSFTRSQTASTSDREVPVLGPL